MRASSIGTISFLRSRLFLQRDYSAIEGRSRSTDCEPRSIDDRPYAAAKNKKRCSVNLRSVSFK
jgi:hypothetical protein